MGESQKYVAWKNPDRRIATIWVLECEVWQKNCMVSEVWVVVPFVGVMLTGKDIREPFWSHGNVLHIDLDGGHTGGSHM